ncbi:MAG: FHIPEP family type III secretion protein [Nannocystaceae bacterium]
MLQAFGGQLAHELPRLSPAFLVVALLVCVLVPLPTIVVDLLLSLSLAMAVLLLAAALRIDRSADFSSFPTLLLLATLYRMALNISTTRLILSEADAGQVVDAFATFVVRSDLVVGGVVFLILTLVQYLVIARGAERVAEVTARFALDALPGHQASIDADLRAEAISPQQAATQRAVLIESSRFYGAMDGAVRFVKHDAVAGLAIIAVNLVGGLAVGMGRFGMSWAESLNTFGRLTIGDGLLAQIPALLVSLAAGVLVARIDRHSSTPWLEPAMLVAPAALLGILALVPGMPALPFGVTAASLLVVAFLHAQRRGPRDASNETPAPLVFRVAADEFTEPRRIERGLSHLLDRCEASLGLRMPKFVLARDTSRPRGRVDMRLGDRSVASIVFKPGHDREDQLWLEGYRAVMAFAPELIDLQSIDGWIEATRREKPAVVQEAMRVVTRPILLELAKGLLRERIPLPPMSMLLGVAAAEPIFHQPSERSRWLDTLRQCTARHWLADLFEGQGDTVTCLRPTPDFEESVLSSCTTASGVLSLAATPEEKQSWVASLRPAPLADRPTANRIIVTSTCARPAFAELLRASVPSIPVISTAEFASAELEIPKVGWVDAT